MIWLVVLSVLVILLVCMVVAICVQTSSHHLDTLERRAADHCQAVIDELYDQAEEVIRWQRG
jgi:hypothetical protein